jgi:hypothetical protein
MQPKVLVRGTIRGPATAPGVVAALNFGRATLSPTVRLLGDGLRQPADSRDGLSAAALLPIYPLSQ